MRVMATPRVSGALGTVFKGMEKGLEELEIMGHTETSIAEISQNTENTTDNQRTLASSQALKEMKI